MAEMAGRLAKLSFIFQTASSEKLFITSPGWPNEENISLKIKFSFIKLFVKIRPENAHSFRVI
jgi:hypothetical protein